jgi:hypothetical protein
MQNEQAVLSSVLSQSATLYEDELLALALSQSLAEQPSGKVQPPPATEHAAEETGEDHAGYESTESGMELEGSSDSERNTAHPMQLSSDEWVPELAEEEEEEDEEIAMVSTQRWRWWVGGCSLGSCIRVYCDRCAFCAPILLTD